jgi:hypothetical protein
MDEKWLPIDYLYRADTDLTTVLWRIPKAPEIVRDACEAARSRVSAARKFLSLKQADREGKTVLKSLKEQFDSSKKQPSDRAREIADWVAGHRESESSAYSVLKWIVDGLQKAKKIDADSVQFELDEAIQRIEHAKERLEPLSESAASETGRLTSSALFCGDPFITLQFTTGVGLGEHAAAMTDEEKARQDALNLRAEKHGYSVHFPNKRLHLGCWYIVAHQPDDADYEDRIELVCQNLDEVEEFIVKKEKAAPGGASNPSALSALIASFAAHTADH